MVWAWLILVAPLAWALVPNPATDLNGDGIVNAADGGIVGTCLRAQRAGGPLPGVCAVPDPHPAGGGDGDWDVDDSREVTANLKQVFPPRDLVAPKFTVAYPANGALLSSATITVTGTIDDATAGVRVNGIRGTVVAGAFSVPGVTLSPGANSLTVTATDPASNVSTTVLQVTYQPPDTQAPVVTIASPANGAVLTTASVTVSGTLDDPTATVTVNGIAATVAGGGFSAAGLPLTEGPNTLTVTATDPAGNTGTAGIQVTYEARDLTGPELTLVGGAERFTPGDAIGLQGTVADARGSAAVVIQSSAFGGAQFAATVAGGLWSASVPLQTGENCLTVVALDQAGNATRIALRVTREQPSGPLTLTLDYPTDGAIVTATPLAVRGTLRSEQPALAIAVLVNGQAATLAATDQATETAFQSRAIALELGSNVLSIEASADGQRVQRILSVEYRPPAEQTPVPTIQVLAPTPGAVLSAATFTLVGEITSEAGLASLRIDGTEVPFTGTRPGPYRFRAPYAFAAGVADRVLALDAQDADGRRGTLELRYSRDDRPPQIVLDGALETPPAVNRAVELPLPLAGEVSDAGLASFTVAGHSVALTAGEGSGRYRFRTALALAAGAVQEVALVAVDRAGNRTERLYLFQADPQVRLELLAPAADLDLTLDSEPIVVDVGVRLGAPFAGSVEARLLAAGGAAVAQAVLRGEELRGGRLTLPQVAGTYRLEVRALDVDGTPRASTGRSIRLQPAQEASLSLVGSDPAAGAEGVEPNAPLTLYFNSPIDPARVTLTLRETAFGETYQDADPPGTDAVYAQGYQLVPVDRSQVQVPGGLSLLPGGRTLAFYPERDLAYGAEVYVDLDNDGAPLARFNYRTRALPTFVSGTVQDLFAQGVGGVEVVLGEGGAARVALSDSGGGFSFGFGDRAAQALPGGRLRLAVNPGMKAAGWGVRRQWVSIQAGRHNALGVLRLPQLNPEVAPVPAAGGATLSLLGGALVLDLGGAELSFPDGQRGGDLYAQFLSFSQIHFPVAPIAMPHFMYALHPGGVAVSGTLALDMGAPALEGGYEHLPPEGSWVVLLGLDPEAGQVVPIGAGQVEGTRIKSRGAVQLRVLDLIGYALAGPQHQEALAAYAAGRLPLVQVLSVLGR